MKGKSEREVAQSCLTLRDPMDRSPPGSSVHGIFQARTLEWGAIAFSECHLHSGNGWKERGRRKQERMDSPLRSPGYEAGNEEERL